MASTSCTVMSPSTASITGMTRACHRGLLDACLLTAQAKHVAQDRVRQVVGVAALDASQSQGDAALHQAGIPMVVAGLWH
jgi:hypothetical protein